MTEQAQRYRIHTHMTKTRFLHAEDALDIGKVRLFAGQYRRGQGADVTAHHFLDVADARVLFSDLAWGKAVDFCEYKGSANGDGGPTSRVLKVRTNDGKVWVRLENGPGQVIGEGAVKPAGDPEAVANVPLTTWEARKLAMAVLAHLQAWEVVTFRKRTQREAIR
jgi:hypothetical protein